MAGQEGPKIVTSGVVLALDATDKNSYPGSGTNWRDLSGYNNNGTLTNGPTFSSTNFGNIVFNGTTQYVDCGNQSSINLTSFMTISTWIKKPYGSAVSVLIDKGRDNYGAWSILSDLTANKIQFKVRVSGVNSSVDSIGSYGNNIWTNITTVFTGTSLLIYFNGILDNSANASGTIGTNAINVSIARANDGYYWSGSISSVLIYNRALTATEILQNYNVMKWKFGL